MSEESTTVNTSQQESLRESLKVGVRTRAETFCDVVRALGAGAQKPTQIMYNANLPLPAVQSYVKTLESQGLVAAAQQEGNRAYRLTKKGYKLLNGLLEVSII